MKKHARNKTRNWELSVYVLLTLLGLIAIWDGVHRGAGIDKITPAFLISIGSSSIGIGITGFFTTFFNMGTANEIKTLLNEILTSVRIYGHEDCKDKLEEISSKDTYRFYKTYNGEKGKWIWKVSKLHLHMERDSRRLSAQLTYRPDVNKSPITYRIQASYWDSHFVWISEDIKNPQEIVIDVYPWMHSSNMDICAGISIRQSLKPNPKRLATPCLIILGYPEKLKELEKLGNLDIKSVDTTWIANPEQCRKLEEIWNKSMIDDIGSFMLTGLREAIDNSTKY